MQKASVLMLAALCCACARSPADDGTDALRRSAKVCQAVDCERVHATLERQEGTWRVTGVNLWAERLTRSDLVRLAALTTLDSLEIRGDCQVAAEAIRELAALARLRRLLLSGQQSGARLKALSHLPKLEDLELDMGAGDQELPHSDLVHLGNLHNLRRLSLGRLGFSFADASVEYVKPLARLEELDLRFSDRITDAGVAQLRGLSNLRVLRLEKLGPKGLSAIKDLPRLEHLSIDTYNPAGGKADFSLLRHLKSLTIHSLAGNATGNICVPENLRRLELGEWWFRKEGRLNLQPAPTHLACLGLCFPPRCSPESKQVELQWLSSFWELRELTLDYAIEKDLITLPALASLRALALTGQSGVITDQGMKVIARFRQLESLRTQNTWRVTDEGMEALRNLPRLRRLEFEVIAGVSEKGLASIWLLKRLRALHLDLSDESLKGLVEDVLARVNTLSELEELSLRGTLTDKGLGNLANLKKLRSLDLRWCDGFTDDGLASLMSSLPGLQVVKRTYERE